METLAIAHRRPQSPTSKCKLGERREREGGVRKIKGKHYLELSVSQFFSYKVLAFLPWQYYSVCTGASSRAHHKHAAMANKVSGPCQILISAGKKPYLIIH